MMRAMTRLLVLIFLVAAGLTAEASLAAIPHCKVAADHPLIGKTRWYGLYYQDKKIGHAETATTMEASDPDKKTITQRFSMTFRLEQTEETIEQVRRFHASPPHELIDGAFQSADRRITYQMRDGDLHLNEDGIDRIWPGLDRYLCDEEEVAIHQFLEGAPSVGRRIETADFDVERQELISSTHDIEDISTRRILGADHVFQTLRTKSSSEAFSYTASTQFQNGEAINLFLGPIEFRAETEAIAHQPNQSIDLFAEFEKPLNRPLKQLSAIEELTLKARIDESDLTIDQVITPGFGQDVDYLDGKTAIIKLAEQPAPREMVDTKTFLRPTSSHPADHPRVKALIDEIKAPLGVGFDDKSLAAAILDFVADYIETVPESPYAYHTTSVFDILDNRIGDCTEHSQLFVTLARAAGLPAREVSGFVYGGNDQAPTLGGHAWVEVLIDGQWIGMDPTWNEIELNKSHVQIMNTLVPSLTFDVLDITYH